MKDHSSLGCALGPTCLKAPNSVLSSAFGCSLLYICLPGIACVSLLYVCLPKGVSSANPIWKDQSTSTASDRGELSSKACLAVIVPAFGGKYMITWYSDL